MRSVESRIAKLEKMTTLSLVPEFFCWSRDGLTENENKILDLMSISPRGKPTKGNDRKEIETTRSVSLIAILQNERWKHEAIDGLLQKHKAQGASIPCHIMAPLIIKLVGKTSDNKPERVC